ncbi:hypothetical protein FBR02_08760 [Anaerolineae bacterium CFX9]|nr:hypothetical protein [Anaerolineae bacterium CFX9]
MAVKPSEPIVIRKARLGQFAGYAGASFLLAGVISVLWSGEFSVVSVILFALGAVGFIAWYAVAPKEFIGFVTGRQMRFSTVSVFSTILLIGIVVLVYGLLQRSAITLDMTQSEQFSLSAETRQVLATLERPMQITGFYSSALLLTREIDDQVFRLYETETDGLIRRQYINPDEQPALAQRYGLTQDGQVFLSYLNEDGSVDFSLVAIVPRGSNYEREMTNAISRLLVAGSLIIYFETSHGQRSALDSSQEGLSGINAGAQESGLITLPLNLAEIAAAGRDIPDDAATIIFARPLSDLSAAEILTIDRYLQRGGALMLLADAVFTENAFLRQDGAFNQYLWENWGIRALDMVVVDPAASGQTALDVISAYVYYDNALGQRIDPAGGTPTLFRIARAVEVNLSFSAPNIANGQVILSSEASYGETNLTALAETNTYTFDEGEDVRGPLAMAVWAANRQTGAKIALIGDSDFVTNGQVLTGGNALLFTDTLAWLSGLDQQITFAPQTFTTSLPLLFVSQQTINLIAGAVIVVFPAALIIIGTIIYSRRSRR